jgi:hypothetical protein
MEGPLFIELIHRTKTLLNTISKLTQLTRGKFLDREFGEFFSKAISRDIEKHNLVLNTFLNYIASTTPIPKRGTVNKIIEEGLKKRQVLLEEKGTKILKEMEKDLPETIVPDEQLRFILDSLLQYVIALTPADGNLKVLTKSFTLPGGAAEDKEFFKRNGKYVEILIAFASQKKPAEQSGKGSGALPPHEEVLADLVYRLVDMIVKKNHGAIRFEVDERESKNKIILKFPVERRRVVHYRLSNESDTRP